jgi:hypothetical protein
MNSLETVKPELIAKTAAPNAARCTFTRYFLQLELGQGTRQTSEDGIFNPQTTLVIAPEFAAELQWVINDAVESLWARIGRPRHTFAIDDRDPFLIPARVAGTKEDYSQATAALEGSAWPDGSIGWEFRSRERKEIEVRKPPFVVVDSASTAIQQDQIELTLGYSGGKGQPAESFAVFLLPEMGRQLARLLCDVLFAFQAQIRPVQKYALPPAIDPERMKLFMRSMTSPSAKSRQFGPPL